MKFLAGLALSLLLPTLAFAQTVPQSSNRDIADMALLMAAEAGRADLVDSTRAELVIVEGFLPQQLSVEEVTVIVQEVIAETGATSMKDIGQVMKPVMQRAKGLADGKLINQIVREQLSS